MTIASSIEVVAVGAGAVAGGCAAALWWLASCVNIPSFPDVGIDSASSVFDPVRNALRESAERNARAAVVSGSAAASAFVGFIAHVAAGAGW